MHYSKIIIDNYVFSLYPSIICNTNCCQCYIAIFGSAMHTKYVVASVCVGVGSCVCVRTCVYVCVYVR